MMHPQMLAALIKDDGGRDALLAHGGINRLVDVFCAVAVDKDACAELMSESSRQRLRRRRRWAEQVLMPCQGR